MDMVCGARSGSSSGRRMSSGRGSSAASTSGPSFVPPPLAAATSPSSVPPPLTVGASTVHETKDAVNPQERRGNFYDGTLWEENELKRPPTFQEVFDKTYKKKGTNQYISDRAREVVESYSQ
ncbi:hypothetical protein Taro_043253 [Colocasia esculenta]|uniref:Uncharacterized protein n=1 Tax=Colocasia esculenta TaxID=4460 RepID=A0A843WRL5_COLES|nr:hypothetical protein [Colocasia esculenta]